MFSELKRAWAVWILSTQSFSAMLDGSWGFDKTSNNMTLKINHKKEEFTEELAMRLQNCQIECADALYVIQSRDSQKSFFYCDPPYYNSDCGHYDGYTEDDYEKLLILLSKIQGRFLLSSYPSAVLEKYIKIQKWQKRSITQKVSIDTSGRKQKLKLEMLVANYPIGEQLKAM